MKTRLPVIVLGLSALTACAGVPKPEGPRSLRRWIATASRSPKARNVWKSR